MIKYFSFLLSLFVVFLIACSDGNSKKDIKSKVNVSEDTEEADTGAYTLQSEKFSIVFPSKPRIESNETETQVGIQRVVMYDLISDDSRFQCIYSDYPQLLLELGDTTELLNGVLDVIKSNTGTDFVKDSAIIKGEWTGKLYDFESDSHLLKVLLLFVDNRLYQLLYRAPKNIESPGMDFINSFSLK